MDRSCDLEESGRSSLRRRTMVSLFALSLVGGAIGGVGGFVAAVSPPASTAGGHGGEFVVEDAVSQFDALKHHGEALAWRNDESAGAIDPSVFDHYQGIVRYPGAGTPTLYVSQLDDDDGGFEGGYLHVVELGSRGTSGERLRSNVQVIGSDTEEVTPAASDTWVRSIRFDGSFSIDGVWFPAYKHPGAAAIVDDVLLVPIDQPRSSSAPTGQIVVFDLAPDRLDPEPIHALPLTHGIDNLTVTRRSDDSFLIWTNGDGGNDINIYETSSADLRSDDLSLDLLQAWEPPTGLQLTPDDYLLGALQGWTPALGEAALAELVWPSGTGAHQSTGFVREPDGSLYLIGMRHPGGLPFAGSDYADLYSVEEGPDSEFVLTRLRTRNFNCVYDGGGGPVDMRICNFTAAGGTYVSPSGELILYSMPHDDEDGFDPDIARVAEFRHRDVNRPGSPLRSGYADAGGLHTVNEGGTVQLDGTGHGPIDPPWVELYDDDGFRDRSIVVDYDDRQLLELNNFNHLDDFNDKPSSVRWRAPLGVDIQLFDDDNYGDRSIILRGTGETEWISDLDDQGVVPGLVEHVPARNSGENIDFGDKTSSMRFVGAPPSVGSAVFEWDLDGDGVFGETGASAQRGDETGNTPLFDAGELDGPSTLQVALQVVVGGDVVATDAATVQVDNVAPTVVLTPNTVSVDEGGAVELSLTITEPAAGDLVEVALDWGDGSTENLALGTERSTAIEHVYVDDDPTGTSSDAVTISAVVSDDDGGSTSSSVTMTIHNVAPVVVIEQLADDLPFALVGVPIVLEGSFTDVGSADTHSEASIMWGDGAMTTTPPDDIEAAHTFDAPGEFAVVVTVTDDDLGVGEATRAVEVMTPEDATAALIEFLDDLVAAHPDVQALVEARSWLSGRADGAAMSGALDKLVAGDMEAALRRFEQFVESLLEADGVDTAIEQQLGALIADSIAHALFDDVVDAFPAPSNGQERQISRIESLLQSGREAESVGDFLAVVDAFHEAVRRSVALLE